MALSHNVVFGAKSLCFSLEAAAYFSFPRVRARGKVVASGTQVSWNPDVREAEQFANNG
jgi:hypothetical protein